MPRDFYAFSNASSADVAELAIYNEIGFFGTSARDFINQLKAVKAPKLVVRINSPGGNVIDGYAIYNLLKQFAGEVEVRIDGIAASIASVIAMAGDKVLMPRNSLLMIHHPWVSIDGNAEELRKTADDLDKLSAGIRGAYAERTNVDAKKLDKWMKEETFFTAEEAIQYGFADELLDAVKVKAQFTPKDYFPSNVDRVEAVYKDETTPPANSGGHQPNNDKPKHDMDLAQAQARIASLEAEKQSVAEANAKAIETAKNTALQDAKNAEKTRRDGITALAKKHGKDGDLDAITIEALTSDITVEQFKDKVLDVVSARPTKGAVKPGADNLGNDGSFEARYKAAKTPEERRQLIRENRAEARRLSVG